MSESIPLKAIPEAIVEGRNIKLSASKSTGDIVAYGWGMSIGSPENAKVKWSPRTSMKGQKGEDQKYISGSCPFISITATVNVPGSYVFILQVMDGDKNADWEHITVKVN